jgi:NAD(P)-dependent dehydrogenase (short-subunit alcohol dehydrogenase family)
MITQQTLIVGANSEIAKALTVQLKQHPTSGVILVSRSSQQMNQVDNVQIKSITLENYQEDQIDHAISEINCLDHAPVTQVIICNGILHSDSIKPEKRIEDFQAEAFNQVMNANALTPMLWIKKLISILSGKSPCKIVVFSARVGSISDNRLGGWYSYRASKSALNMMLKTTSIELARRDKNIKLVAFHPGTTDTPLSKPFQRNVPANKLFTCEFVAKQLLSIIKEIPFDQQVSYLDWQGKKINW